MFRYTIRENKNIRYLHIIHKNQKLTISKRNVAAVFKFIMDRMLEHWSGRLINIYEIDSVNLKLEKNVKTNFKVQN